MNYFVSLIGLFLVLFVIGGMIRLFMKKYSFGLSLSQKYPVKDTLVWMFRNPETRKRLLITLGILIVLRVFFYIPIPGINISALKSFFSEIAKTSSVGFSFFWGGAFTKLSVAALGMLPFISACVLLQLVSIIIPPLRRLSFRGEEGRNKLSNYTYVLTIILSLVSGLFLSMWLQNPANFRGFVIAPSAGPVFTLISTLTVTVGVIIFLLAAALINRYGIGNGIPIIIITSILFRAPHTISLAVQNLKSGKESSYLPFLWAIIFIAAAYFIFYITRLTRKLKIKGNDDKQASVSFRPTILGIIPLVLATNIIAFPASVNFFRGGPFLSTGAYIGGEIFHYILFILLVPVFTYLYIYVVFTPKYLHRLLRKHNYSLAEVETGQKGSSFKKSIWKVLSITALFLIGIYIIPKFVLTLFEVPSFTLTNLICGISLAIVVGVFSDIINQLEFFKDKDNSEAKDWDVCYIAFDEMEAEVKKNYLKDKGIEALIKPYRYSWGLPIRTIVDQYQIYVPASSKEEARKLILA